MVVARLLLKGRPTQMHPLEVPQKKAKRSHGLAEAVISNRQSSKKSGSHVMKSKTKHFQKKKANLNRKHC